MPPKEKKKKNRKEHLKSMVKGTGVSKQYLDYADINPKDVHEGSATYRGQSLNDDASRANYGSNVNRGEGKSYFKYQGKIYQITGSSGYAGVEVTV